MIEFLLSEQCLPVIFTALMGIAVWVYVVLDGYDLGVGILTAKANLQEKNVLYASIAPFWDANETWLVLGVGLLLIAFPVAHGIILTQLYSPVFLMLAGLILRGVSFEFRAKASVNHQHLWDNAFTFGSILAALSQGYMLGSYITGFKHDLKSIGFSLLSAVCLAVGYVFVGSNWLIIRTEGEIQKKYIKISRYALWGTVFGLALVSIATPLISQRIFDRWFTFPNFLYMMPVPLLTGTLVLYLDRTLKQLDKVTDKRTWVPFAGNIGLYALGFIGLSYSFYPYIVPEEITIWQAASAPESLRVILFGALLVLPFIFGYTFYIYKIFWGKVSPH